RAQTPLLRSHNPINILVPLLKMAFAGGLLRFERSCLTLGVRDGGLAARKPGEACGEDEGEKHHSRCEAEANALDEVGVGSRKDRLMLRGVKKLDRSDGTAHDSGSD